MESRGSNSGSSIASLLSTHSDQGEVTGRGAFTPRLSRVSQIPDQSHGGIAANIEPQQPNQTDTRTKAHGTGLDHSVAMSELGNWAVGVMMGARTLGSQWVCWLWSQLGSWEEVRKTRQHT
ncbi:hypothetical protein XELAEV_18027012mg [Xenopus laevis]|uniref:Uncharacterized protein n=1 Tax=Xenopus laevis TaxID=8355 RepID=A0A974CX41_XENLA|nr:hypothetical protein XELAEV_18027012mg [Xenopus laevis]